MKQLSKGDGRVVKIVKKKTVLPEARCRLSRFVYSCETGDGTALVKNTLTKQVYALDADEWAAVRAADLSHPAARELAELRFLVEPDYDETAQYELVLAVLRTMEPKKTGIGSYTILPTTGCNARCVYCYEEGWPVKTMNDATADAAADFILRTKREKKIRLSWFGGEPLVGAATISRICRKLREAGADYDSSIVTNATLLTPEMVREAAELWHLKRAQVSMDGARADYEARKSYVNAGLHNYDTAMRAVERLSDAGVSVVLRCNYDGENLPRMREFFSDCAARFAGRKNISVYLEQLFQSSTREENAALFLAADRAEAELVPLGLSSGSRVDRALKLHYCMADSGGGSVIIDPEGGLHLCEHLISGEPFGTVFDEAPVFPAPPAAAIAEECKTCCFLPDCTAFRKSGCPVQIAACRTQTELRTKRALEAMRDNAAEDDAEDAAEETGGCP